MERINNRVNLYAIEEGEIIGSNNTNHFYFFCPQCRDTQVMQVIDCDFETDEKLSRKDKDNKIDDQRKKDLTVAFKLYCTKCKLHRRVKISSMGLHSVKLTDRFLSDELRGKTLQWI